MLVTACGADYMFTLYGSVEPEKWKQAEKEDKIEEVPGYTQRTSILVYYSSSKSPLSWRMRIYGWCMLDSL